MQVSKMIDVIFERTSEKSSMKEDISCRFDKVISDFENKVSILNHTSVFGSTIKNPYTLLEYAVKDYQSRLEAKLKAEMSKK